MHGAAWSCGNTAHGALTAGEWEYEAQLQSVGPPGVALRAHESRKLRGSCFML